MGPSSFFDVFLCGFGLGLGVFWQRGRPRIWFQLGPVNAALDFEAFAP